MALRASDRYRSPRAPADDIELWLADEPVGAWSEPLWVRLARWARRHKPIVATATAILVTTSLASAIGTRLVAIERDQARRERDEARRQRQEARVERDRAVDLSIQSAIKEMQLRDALANRLLREQDPRSAFEIALMALDAREELIRRHPGHTELKEERVDSLLFLCQDHGRPGYRVVEMGRGEA